MANNLTLAADLKRVNDMLFKLFQSTRLNFMLGSGASMPAINIAGDIEGLVQSSYNDGNELLAEQTLYSFLQNINTATAKLVQNYSDPNITLVKGSYAGLIRNIERILNERRTNLLPKQANVFTPNYDLFVESVIEKFDSITLNDGFNRKPSLTGKFQYSTQTFFNSIYNNGNLYDYQVELPTINLCKIHGSMSWAIEGEKIVYSIRNYPPIIPPPPAPAVPAAHSVAPPPPPPDITVFRAYNDDHALVLPRKHKFAETVQQQVFYDLLRLYANELDKENTTLISFGFSFVDEHILDITERALKNPTLKILIFAYNDEARDQFLEIFKNHHNVDVISTGDATNIDFTKLNELFNEVLPADKSDATS